MLMRPIQNKANQTEASGGEDDIQRPVGTRDDEVDQGYECHEGEN